MDDEIEYTLLNKNECMLYQIPPATAAGHKADDWKDCVWRGKLRISAKGNDVHIRFIHASGENMGNSLVEVVIVDGDCDKYVERATDSSRYFAIKVVDASGAKKTFIGLGFKERNDAFDFNCTLQDFKNRNVVEKQEPIPTKDYSLKEGEKITVNFKGIKHKKKDAAAPISTGGGLGFLPPPPSSSARKQGEFASPMAPPPTAASAAAAAPADDFFCDFDDFQSATTTAAPAVASAQPVQLPPGNGIGNQNFMAPSFAAAPPPMSAAAPPIQAYAVPAPTQPASIDPFSGLGNLNAAPAAAPVFVATSATITSPSPPQNQTIPSNQINIGDPLSLDIFK